MFSVLSNKDFSFLQKIRWLRLLIRAGFDRRFDRLVSLIFEFIPNDRPIVIDVGANVGNFTRSCVKQKKKTSLIIAVEPSHYVFPILELWSKFWASKDSKTELAFYDDLYSRDDLPENLEALKKT